MWARGRSGGGIGRDEVIHSRSPPSRRRGFLGGSSGAAGLLLPRRIRSERALENVMEAISLYLETLREEGRKAPHDADVVYQVKVAI